ncbi:MAG: TonB-dependent receptor [Myxococcota bacterium]
MGVINIVTKKGADIGGLFVEGGAGSFNTGRAAIAYGQKFGDLDVMFFGNFQTTNEGEVNVMRQTTAIPPDFAFPLDDEDPDNPTIYNPGGPPRFQRPGSTDPRADFFVDFIGTLNWRGFSLFTKVAWERDYYQISSSTGALLQDDQSFDKDPATIISLGYATRFFDEAVGLQTRVYLWSQEFQVDSVIFPSSPNSIPNPFILRLAIDNQFRYGANLEIDAKLPLGNTLLAGIEYYRAEISGARLAFFGPNTGNFIDGGELVPDSESNVISVYVNNELNLFERIAVSGGVRFNYSDTYASAFLASANIVGQLLDYDSVQSYLKLSYTQGFRPPSFEQRFSTAPFFLGNQNIGPERSEAFQVELNAKLLRDKGPIRHLTIRADFAHTELKDLIALRDSEDGQSAQFNNLGTRVVDSVEAALDLRFKRGHQMWATYSFNQVRDTTAQIDIRNNAPHIINVGGLVRLNKHLAFNARLSWVDAKQIRDYLDPDTLQTRALTIDAYTLLSAGVVISDAEQRYRLLIHAYNMLGYQYETVDGDTVAAPYPYQQPNRVALLSRFQATF